MRSYFKAISPTAIILLYYGNHCSSVRRIDWFWGLRGEQISDRVLVHGVIILKLITPLFLLFTGVFVPGAISAQALAPGAGDVPAESSSLLPATDLPPAPIPASTLVPVADVSGQAFTGYIFPTQQERYRNYAWNALGPVAFAGSSFAAAIDQGFNFPHKWGQGMDAYGARVASNLGISLVTATAQYSLAEAFHEDTAYYHCECRGFFPRFRHAAISTVASRRGSDGHRSFSVALTMSPFVGPLVAANTWIPSHNGPMLGFHMGEHNLLGQFAQDEALEFLYGGPTTLLGRIERRFLKKSSDSDSNP